MKRLFLIIALCVIALCVIAQGQTKPDPIKRLNPDSSATWQRIDQAQQVENDRHDKEIARLNELRVVMLQAAGIPKEAWAHCTVESTGIVACVTPETAKAKPQP